MLNWVADKMNREIFSRYRQSLLGTGLLSLLCNFTALGNPTGGAVTQGSASFSTSGSTFNINQTSANAFISWQTFNINAGETVNFSQPTVNSVAWNQINDVNPSQILGNLNANGYVVLENANGFYIGGSAVLTAHGLILTTATPSINFSDGGPWSFDAPPPTAQIQNYGQINITGGGTAYLIAADIVNGGTITAPNGHIGLYDGETVLVSMSPNGQALSAQVTLPKGSVDNEGKLTAAGGSVVAQAQFVNQNGIIQASTAANVNGTIELLGSSVTLGAGSSISAAGDSTAGSASAGGAVQIQAGTSFSDFSGSAINVAGAAQGGNAGQISFSAPQMSALHSALNGQAAANFLNGTLSIDTADIVLNSDGSPVAGALALNVNALASGLSQINLLASGDITLAAPWVVAPNGGIPGSVSLQAGNEIALNSGSGIQANGGNIILKAPMVDLSGTLQANSVASANGVIEIDASQSLTLESSSIISANGDSSASSPGGFLVLNAGNTFTVDSGSAISAFGHSGGQSGIIEIFDPGASTSPIQPAGQYFALLLNPYNLTLSSSATTPSSANPNINVSDLAAYSQIDLQALDNIELSAAWTLNALNNASLPATLGLTAGNNIILDAGSSISAAQNWTVNLTAGAAFVPTTAHPTPASGSDGIYLDYNPNTSLISSIQSQNGNINLWAANEVQVGWSGASAGPGVVNPGASSITTTRGGNINVTTLHGDVNSGSGASGFIYQSKAPYYRINNLGGISTGAGGNVTIVAGGNAISYTPSSSDSSIGSDPGTGAFGTAPGNVTITAGDNVYGHYVLANGVGTITAENGNVGTDGSDNADPFALSLISGSWNVNAPNGNIYLTEVRNPNADYNNVAPGLGQPAATSGKNLFTYGANDAVDLTAGAGVYLTDSLLPRLSSPNDPVPVIYPSILDITAGAGGVTLDGNITLFPSVDQNLEIITTDGGSLMSGAPAGVTPELLMSDSSLTRWVNTASFLDADNGTILPIEYQPVIINISGDLGGPKLTSTGINIITTKATDITVGGDLINSGFSGQNLSVNDVTSINVSGQIFNSSTYSFVDDITIPEVPADNLPPNLGESWLDIFALAVDPTIIANVKLNPNLAPSQYLDIILGEASLFPVSVVNGTLVGTNPGFVYDATTGKLGFAGQMTATLLSQLTPAQGITVLHLVNGVPVVDENPGDKSPGRTFGQFETDTISWVPASAIQTLAQNSQGAPSPNLPQLGYRIGGPGEFDVMADAISLGNTYGILSCGVADPGGFGRYGNLVSLTPSGATVNVTVTGPDTAQGSALDMLTSAIAALGGGDVNVISLHGSMDLGSEELFNINRVTGVGVYSSGGGGVNVTALDDIDIDGSRIGTYNGGDILVESLTGDVNVGNGGNSLNGVFVAFVNPLTGLAANYPEQTYGSGIIANTLVPVFPGSGLLWPPKVAKVPGNITVETPEGDIISSQAGIIQEALDGSSTAGPTVTLEAGTFASGTPGQPGYIAPHAGNIDLGNAGVIGGNVNLSANGNITGQVVSRQNSTINAADSFSGTILSVGNTTVTGSGTISGTIIGVGGVNVSGGGGVTASVLGQNVSVNGGAATSTLGSSATATSATQSAAQQANTQSQQQIASDQAPQTGHKEKKSEVKVSRVTVLLSAAVPR